jgi:hypothetical protein
MFCACRGQLVNPDTPVCRGNAPFGFHELSFEKALESRIKRSFFDLKQIVGRSFDMLREGIAMQRLPLQGAENHHFQSAWKQVTLFVAFHFWQGELPLRG